MRGLQIEQQMLDRERAQQAQVKSGRWLLGMPGSDCRRANGCFSRLWCREFRKRLSVAITWAWLI
jgi:hypothetical protein